MTVRRMCVVAVILASISVLAIFTIDGFVARTVLPAATSNGALLNPFISVLEYVFAFPVSKFATGLAIVLASLVAFPLARYRRVAWLLLFVGVSHLTTRLLAGVLKNVFLRTRPLEALADGSWNDRFFVDGGSSFPSGHAAHFWALFFALAVAFPRVRIPALVLAVFVSVARIAVDDHYVSDVLASASIAAFVTCGFALLILPRAARAQARISAPAAVAALMLFLLPGLPVHADPIQRLDERLAALRKEHKLPGLAVAVVKDRKVAWTQAYGWAYVDDEVRMTPDTPMWIASVTKPLVAALFVKLEDAGVVRMEDRINDVPEWAELCGWLAGSKLPFGKDLRCAAPITIRDILQHRVNGAPGDRFLYNPIVFSRLSRYIEVKLGGSVRDVEGHHHRMAQLMEQHILGPAGMRRTMGSQWQRDKADVFFDMAQGYGVEGDQWVAKARPERHLAGGAGIVSTVEDLARFDIALDGGTLVKDPVRLFTPPRRADGTPSPYAYGWFVQEYRGERLYWHSGVDEEAGFSALHLKVPGRGLTFIVLANGDGIRWNNPLDAAAVEQSAFAQAFLETFVFSTVVPASARTPN